MKAAGGGPILPLDGVDQAEIVRRRGNGRCGREARAGDQRQQRHMHDNLPLVLVGGGTGRIKGGRHVRYPKDTPVTNLFLNMLDKLGVPADRIGDSTGRLECLAEV